MSSDDHIVLFRRVPVALRSPVYERFARRLRRAVAGGRSFQCLITTDADLRRLNRDFRGQDYATDVLSFPSAGDGGLGDIAISLQRARAQAIRYGHALEKEICVLLLHGVLHLLGHDHETDRGGMARAEKRWRRALGLPGGLIERVSP
jgi:probable rRNA maturation factor